MNHLSRRLQWHDIPQVPGVCASVAGYTTVRPWVGCIALIRPISYPSTTVRGCCGWLAAARGAYNSCLSVVIVEVNLRSRPLSQKLSLVYWYTGHRLYVSIVLDIGIMITIRVCPCSQEERESTCVAKCHCCDTGIRWWKYKIGFGFCDPYEKNSMWL